MFECASPKLPSYCPILEYIGKKTFNKGRLEPIGMDFSLSIELQHPEVPQFWPIAKQVSTVVGVRKAVRKKDGVVVSLKISGRADKYYTVTTL